MALLARRSLDSEMGREGGGGLGFWVYIFGGLGFPFRL